MQTTVPAPLTPTRRKRILLWVIASSIVVGICVTRSFHKTPLSIFNAKYETIQDGMTVDEVDQILAGYSSKTVFEESDAAWFGKPLKNRSMFYKDYELVPGNPENRVIMVFFDKDYRVVDKWIGAFDW